MLWNIEPTIIAPCSSLMICLNFCSRTSKHQYGNSKMPEYREKQSNIIHKLQLPRFTPKSIIIFILKMCQPKTYHYIFL